MNGQRNRGWGRREFISTLGAAATGTLLGLRSEPAAAEPPPETTRIRLIEISGVCIAPQYVAKDLLHSEGFTDVSYVGIPTTGIEAARALAAGKGDIMISFVAPLVMQIDAGDPIVMIGGVHVGCFALFGTERVHAVRDLKGKTVGVQALGSSQHVFLASMMAQVGLDAKKDVNWAMHPSRESMRLLAEGRIDAFLAFPPETQELRARKIGHVIVDSGKDRPWSQYFCCLVGSHQDFVRKYPVATKRALRAILKASNLCALEPQRAARLIAARGYDYDYSLETLKDIPYDKWRDYDAEDSARYYALRLQEAGMIKSSPQKIIAQGTDWRFLRELKQELKT
ncbi:MAG TPA: ABC transporter substrate-binding protein [Burkholderiales bacterium]|nr:ABC transporter substrate-binding protein [Burkholderiales bacterium]